VRRCIQAEYTGKLGFYVAWVDDNLRDKHRHSPTIGIWSVPAIMDSDLGRDLVDVSVS